MAESRTVEMSRAECLRQLQHGAFLGRVAFVADGVVQLRPVNYLADEGGLVFCTVSRAVLGAASSATPVVFEVDGSDPMNHSGWSVIMRGTLREITDPQEVEYLRRGPLRSWAVSPREHWVRVDLEDISGVRIPAQ